MYIYISFYTIHVAWSFLTRAIIFKWGGGGDNHPWMNETRHEEVLIKKMFHLTHKENFNKIKEVLTKPGKLWLPD